MKKNIGFTLIELMIAVTVIMVLAGIGAMSLNDFNDVKKIESIRAEVSNHIKLARNLAITKQLPNNKVNLKYVRVVISNNEITIGGVDDADAVFYTPPYSKMKIDPKSGVNVTSSVNFGFSKNLGRLTDSNGVEISVPVVINVSRGTNTKTINISDLGTISYEN